MSTQTLEIQRWHWGMLNGNVLVMCHHCLGFISLVTHSVNEEGYVVPFLICPYCKRKDRVRLIGWGKHEH